MSRLSSPEFDRLRELLADEVLGQIDSNDASELDALRSRASAEQKAEIDQTFGELLVALMSQSDEAMPAEAKSKLIARGSRRTAADGGPETEALKAPMQIPTPRATMGPLGKLGWVAAAAALALAATAWWTRPTPVIPTDVPSPITRVATAPDTVRIELAPQGDLAESVSERSELLWNQQLQEGVLRLEGVPANDPSQIQYQLWIFDATRGEFAVDGGVFDLTGETETDEQGRLLVHFRPKLLVGDPAAFAVTQERPGGVVVTDQSALILLGTPDGS